MGFRLTVAQLTTTSRFLRRSVSKATDVPRIGTGGRLHSNGNSVKANGTTTSSTHGTDSRRTTCLRSFSLSWVIYYRRVIRSPASPGARRSEVHAHSRRGKTTRKLFSSRGLPGHARVGRVADRRRAFAQQFPVDLVNWPRCSFIVGAPKRGLFTALPLKSSHRRQRKTLVLLAFFSLALLPSSDGCLWSPLTRHT